MRILAALVVFILVVTFHASVEDDRYRANKENTAFAYSLRSLMIAAISVAAGVGVIIKF